MEYSIYLKTNGEILRTFHGTENDLAGNIAPGEAAVLGAGSWRTHRVVGGELVKHETARVAPADHLAWNPTDAAWFDPLLAADPHPGVIRDRRETLKMKIAEAEAASARPQRDLWAAWVTGQEASPADTAYLLEKVALISKLREELKGLSQDD